MARSKEHCAELQLGESISELAMSSDSLVRQAAQRWIGRNTTWLQLEQQFNSGDLPFARVALAAAMWKWNDTVENGTIPEGVKLGAAAEKHLSGFHYVDDPKSNLKTESEKHGIPSRRPSHDGLVEADGGGES